MNSKSRIFTLHYAASLWIKPLREIIISDLLNFLCSLWKNPSFGKGSLLLAVFWPPLGCMRMGLAPGILLHQEMESSQGCAGLVTLSDSVSLCFTQCVLLCSALSMWVLWHLPNPTAISPLHREDGGWGHPAIQREGRVQANCPGWASGRGLLATVAPCSLKLLLLFSSPQAKPCSSPSLTAARFPSSSDTKTPGRSAQTSAPDVRLFLNQIVVSCAIKDCR